MHPGRRGDRVLSLGFWAGLLALLGGLMWLAVVLVTQGVDRAGTWATVLGTGLAITGALVTLVTWRLRQRAVARVPASADQVARAAQELRSAVLRQWRKEEEARSLGNLDPMPVRWKLSDPDVMDHAEHIASRPLRFSGRGDQIGVLTDKFLNNLSRRRLVIVGYAGSGKTTMAVQLLLHLLEGWQPDAPVPVLLSLASWDPQVQPRVQDWVAAQLAQTYSELRAFPSDTAQRLADEGRLLPVLDGLDEIPAVRRGKVIKALNTSLHHDTGVIVTSRTKEYRDTVHACCVLTGAAVIEPEPLTACEAATYLKARLPHPDQSWQEVLTALRGGTAGALAEVVTSPLGLWLLVTVHIEGGQDPKPLIQAGKYSDATAIQHHLLHELIPAAIDSRPPLSGGQDPLRPKHQHDPEQARRWLTTLASELRDTGTRDWRWWQLVDTIPRLARGVSVGLIAGLLFGFAGVLGGAGVPDLTYRLEGGLLLGLVFGLAAGLSYGLSKKPAPLRVETRFQGTLAPFRRRLVPGFAMGVGVGLGVGLPYEGALAAGLTFGFAVAAPVWLGIPADDSKVPSPGVVLIQDRTAAVSFGLALGLPFGLAGGLVIGFPSGLAFGVIGGVEAMLIGVLMGGVAGGVLGDRAYGRVGKYTFALGGAVVGGLVFEPTDTGSHPILGLAYGVAFGLAVGCLGVLSRAWGAYRVSRLWLRLCGGGGQPPDLMAFLDDAYRLGLLRVVGSVYQFRHATLQDHLAPPPAPAVNQLATTPPTTAPRITW